MDTLKPLTAADRCDACQARAQMLAIMPSGSQLLFCNHHGMKHMQALRDTGATIKTAPELSEPALV